MPNLLQEGKPVIAILPKYEWHRSQAGCFITQYR
jgi:hypothetical protein